MGKTNELIKSIFEVFSGVVVALYIVTFFVSNYVFFLILSKNQFLSMIVGLVFGAGSFFFFIYLSKKMKRKIFMNKEIGKYTRSVNFYMKTSGKNVRHALELSKGGLDPELQKDIDVTLEHLKKTGEVKTAHFDKYKLSVLDLFHDILAITDSVGYKKKTFERLNRRISNMNVRVDEMLRGKKATNMGVVGLTLIAFIIYYYLNHSSPNIYRTFIASSNAQITLLCCYAATMINLFFAQKNCCDISLEI